MGDLAALRLTSGRPTSTTVLLLCILAKLMGRLVVKVLTAGTTPPVIDSRASVTRTAATCNLIVLERRNSSVQARISRLIPPSQFKLQLSSSQRMRQPLD